MLQAADRRDSARRDREPAALVGLAARSLDELHRRQGSRPEAPETSPRSRTRACEPRRRAACVATTEGLERHQHQHQQGQLPRQAQHQRHRAEQADHAASPRRTGYPPRNAGSRRRRRRGATAVALCADGRRRRATASAGGDRGRCAARTGWEPDRRGAIAGSGEKARCRRCRPRSSRRRPSAGVR